MKTKFDTTEVQSILERIAGHGPPQGEKPAGTACAFCDMGGAGYSSRGDGFHDDACAVKDAQLLLASVKAAPKMTGTVPSQAWAIVNRIGNIANRPDIRAVQAEQQQAICDLVAQVERETLEWAKTVINEELPGDLYVTRSRMMGRLDKIRDTPEPVPGCMECGTYCSVPGHSYVIK